MKLTLKIRNPEMKEQLQLIGVTVNTQPAKLGAPATIVEHVPAIPSTGTLTLAAAPGADETIVFELDDVTETFKYVVAATEEFDIEIGADATEAQANTVVAVNAKSTLVTLEDFASDESLVTAKVAGVAGDSIATTDTLAEEGDGFAAIVLAGGVDEVEGVEGTVGAAGEIRYTDTHIYVSVAESTKTVNNWKKAAFV